MRQAVVIVAGLLIAGCVTPEPEEAAAVEPAPATTYATLDSKSGCAWFCEPSVAILPTGEWFALGDRLTRSLDNGSTFEDVALPPSPLGPTSFQTDSMVHAAPDGTLFYSALVASCPLTCVALFLGGVQVARSSDLGETWESTFLSIPTHPNGPGADRQWLVFGAEGVVCVHFQYIGQALPAVGWTSLTPPEIRASCSTDGGRSFPDFVSVSGPTPYGAINGRGAFDAEGRLYIPYFRIDQDLQLFVAVSDDRGTSFDPIEVPGAAGDYFPAMAIDANGALHLLWRDTDAAVRHATSADRGATWTEPRLASAEGEKTPTSPWIEARGSEIVATWFVVESEEANALVAWDGVDQTTLAMELPNGAYRVAATDLAHLAVTPSGKAIVIFGDLESEEARLAVES